MMSLCDKKEIRCDFAEPIFERLSSNVAEAATFALLSIHPRSRALIQANLPPNYIYRHVSTVCLSLIWLEVAWVKYIYADLGEEGATTLLLWLTEFLLCMLPFRTDQDSPSCPYALLLSSSLYPLPATSNLFPLPILPTPLLRNGTTGLLLNALPGPKSGFPPKLPNTSPI